MKLTIPNITIKTSVPCLACGQLVDVSATVARFAQKSGVYCPNCMPSKTAQRADKWNREAYAAYLQSRHWQDFRRQALDYYGRKCYLCGEEPEAIELHHNTYARLGGERISDVIPLCRDCHQAVTDIQKAREL